MNYKLKKEKIVYNNLEIGRNKPAYIIAEAGINHNGKMTNATKLIDHASEIGVNAIKFQLFDTTKLSTSNAKLANYQKKTSLKTQNELLKPVQLSKNEIIYLQKYANKKKLDFLSSAFDIESQEFLIKIGVPMLKIASGEITNDPLIISAAKSNLPTIISTGMSTINEINYTEKLFLKFNKKLILLHCVSLYPTPLNELNLNFLLTLSKKSKSLIGFSDHSIGIEAAATATALGAKVIEKHITLDKRMIGPDHKASLNPKEFESFVKNIRKCESMLGQFNKVISNEEKNTKKLVRKGLYANENLKIGTVIKESHISILRPMSSIKPNQIKNIIGKKLKNSIKQGDAFRLKDFF